MRVLESFQIQRIQIIALSVGGKHIHMLLKRPERNPKVVVGKAKYNVTRKLKMAGLVDLPEGARLWALGSHPEPITGRGHQENTFQYILDHANEGAWVWSFRDGFPLPRT
jgi:hypothetical protein